MFVYFQLWDSRQFNYFINLFMGYNGLIFVIDWYYEERNWVVFVGRDKIIKVVYKFSVGNWVYLFKEQ